MFVTRKCNSLHTLACLNAGSFLFMHDQFMFCSQFVTFRCFHSFFFYLLSHFLISIYAYARIPETRKKPFNCRKKERKKKIIYKIRPEEKENSTHMQTNSSDFQWVTLNFQYGTFFALAPNWKKKLFLKTNNTQFVFNMFLSIWTCVH